VHEPRLLPLNPPSPWLLGTTDTLTGAYTLVPELVSTEASGARTVETLRATREYRADGTLRREERLLRSGTLVSREYYPGGRLQQKKSSQLSSSKSSSRHWNESGQLTRASHTTRNGHHFARHRNRNGRMPLFKSRYEVSPRFR
jgi:hypothetical protein